MSMVVRWSTVPVRCEVSWKTVRKFSTDLDSNYSSDRNCLALTCEYPSVLHSILVYHTVSSIILCRILVYYTEYYTADNLLRTLLLVVVILSEYTNNLLSTTLHSQRAAEHQHH